MPLRSGRAFRRSRGALSPAVGSVSSSGLYTAPASVTTQQQATITASIASAPPQTAEAKAIILPPLTISVIPAGGTFARRSIQAVQHAVSSAINSSVGVEHQPANRQHQPGRGACKCRESFQFDQNHVEATGAGIGSRVGYRTLGPADLSGRQFHRALCSVARLHFGVDAGE